MIFDPPLRPAILLRRYKRFLADVLVDGSQTTVHCANTGSMTNCIVEGSPCWLSESSNKKRKYPFSLELVTSATGHLAGVNTLRANALVAEALREGRIEALADYEHYQAEVSIGANSRADFLLRHGSESFRSPCYLEVKSVTYGLPGGAGIFPDAKSQRASRHLDELMAVKREGYQAMLLFCVQHAGIDRVSPADEIDPVYGQKLRQAAAAGVQVLAYRCRLSASELRLDVPLDVVF